MSTTRYAKSTTGEIVYCIRVPESVSEKKHEITKSYNQFCDFHKQLGEYIPQSLLPQLPPSGFSLFNSTKFYTQRAIALQSYTESLCESEAASTCPVFLDFVGASTPGEAKESESERAVKEILHNSELAKIDFPEMPLGKVPVLKELSLNTAVGSTNKFLVQLNAVYVRLFESKTASDALDVLSSADLDHGFDLKVSSLESSSIEIEETLRERPVEDETVATYLQGLVGAINEAKQFVSALDLLNSILMIQKMEEKTQKANPNAKIAEEYAPWYSAQADRLIPLLFSDDEKTCATSLEFLRLIEAAMTRDAQASRDLGDDVTSAVLESTREEVSRAIQCRNGDGSSNSKANKNSEAFFRLKAQEFETAMFDLISKADTVNDIEDPDDNESAVKSYRAQILGMMRDLRQLRTDITKAIGAVEEDRTLDEDEDERRRRVSGLKRTSERVEELQQNIGDFEEAWSRRVVAEKPTRESRIRDEQVSNVQMATLALEDDIYEL